MHSRNQNKPLMMPLYNPTRNPSNVRNGIILQKGEGEGFDEVWLDKRRKIGGGKMVGQAPYTRSRLPQPGVNAKPGSRGAVPASENSNGDGTGDQLEFKFRGDVEKLLAEKLNPKNRNNDKGRNKELRDNIKKFKTCINWYMELEDGYLAEQEKLRGMLESEQRRMESEQRRHSDIEAHMSYKIDELTLLNEELQKHVVSLEESLRKEEADKLAVIESYEKEVEAKVASENLCFGLLEELEIATRVIKYLNDQVKMVRETDKLLHGYNTSLQQYINNLQAYAVKNGDTITKLQNDKTVMMETLAGLWDQSSSLKNQLDTIRSSQQEAIKQREEFRKEVGCLRSELQQVRVDRDQQLEHVQCMTVELKEYEENNEEIIRDLDIAKTMASALEETCSSQRDQLKSLDYQLAIANEKLKRRDQEDEAKNKLVNELQSHVTDLECQLVEAEKLQKLSEI